MKLLYSCPLNDKKWYNRVNAPSCLVVTHGYQNSIPLGLTLSCLPTLHDCNDIVSEWLCWWLTNAGLRENLNFCSRDITLICIESGYENNGMQFWISLVTLQGGGFLFACLFCFCFVFCVCQYNYDLFARWFNKVYTWPAWYDLSTGSSNWRGSFPSNISDVKKKVKVVKAHDLKNLSSEHHLKMSYNCSKVRNSTRIRESILAKILLNKVMRNQVDSWIYISLKQTEWRRIQRFS